MYYRHISIVYRVPPPHLTLSLPLYRLTTSTIPPSKNDPAFLYNSPSSLPSLHEMGTDNNATSNSKSHHGNNSRSHSHRRILHATNTNSNTNTNTTATTNNNSNGSSPLPWAADECAAIRRAVMLTEEQYNRAQAGGSMGNIL